MNNGIGWGEVLTIIFIAAPVAYAAAKFLMSKYAEQWIENKFKVSLENLRHEQAKTIAMLKVDVDSLLAGRLKIQDKEFESLGTAWQMLSDLMVEMSGFMSPARIESTFGSFTETDWADFLDRLGPDFSDIERRRILNAPNRADTYNEVLYWRDLSHASNLENSLRIYLAKFGIFMPAEIVTAMENIALKGKTIINMHRLTPYNERFRIYADSLRDYERDFKGPYDALHATIKGRLASHATA
nr:hypothetical protein [Herbaspirillum sp. ASV7]